jgi:PAS domain S-box-containing protein
MEPEQIHSADRLPNAALQQNELQQADKPHTESLQQQTAQVTDTPSGNTTDPGFIQSLIPDLIQQAIIVTDLDGIIIYWNSYATALFGWSGDEVMGKNVMTLIPTDLSLTEGMAIMEQLKRGQSWSGQYGVKHKNGQRFLAHVHDSPFYDRLGQLAGIIGVSRDITEELKTKEFIRLQTKLLDNVEQSVLVSHLDGNIFYSNRFAEELYGWSKAELKQMSIMQLLSDGESKRSIHELTALLQQKNGFAEERKLKTQQGHSYDVFNLYSSLKNAEGKPTGIITVSIDITREMNVRREKEFEHFNQQALINATNDLIWSVDVNYALITANQSFIERMRDYTKVTVKTGEYLLKETVFPPDHLAFWKKMYDRGFSGERFSFELHVPTLIGVADRWSETTINPIFNTAKQVIGIACYSRDITDAKRAQKAISESQERFRIMFEQAPLGIALIDSYNGNILHVNEKFASIAGRTTDELKTIDWMSITHPDDVEADLENMRMLNREEIPGFTMQKRYLKTDGSIVWIQMSIVPIEHKELENPRHLCMIEDITQMKASQQKVELSNERFNLVAKATNDMIWDWDIINNTVYRNEEQFCRILKLPASLKDGAGDFWFSRIHPEDLPRLQSLLEKVQTNAEQHIFEIEFRFLNGEDHYIYLLDRGYILRNAEGIPVRMIGSTQDITRQREINSELEKLSRIARETKNGVIITDKNERIEWVNAAFEQISGYTLEEIKGRKPGEFLQGKDTDPAQLAYIRSQLRKLVNFETELINYNKNGEAYWTHLQVQPIFDNQGNLLQFFSTQTDITTQKKAEEALIRSEEQYRYMFDNNPAPIFIWNVDDFSFAEVNETFLDVYGYTRSELEAITIKDIRPKEEEPTIVAFAKKVRETAQLHVIRLWKHKTKKGRLIYMQISSQKIIYKNRIAILAIAIDVTEKKMLELKLEEERRHKEKEITNAVITAQENEKEHIALELHDNVNQILASARLYFGVSKKTISQDTIQQADELIGKAIHEIRLLCHSLVPPSFDITNLSDGIEQVVAHIEHETDIRFIKQYHNTDYTNLPQVMQLTIYRTVQEQLNNILKYAKAKNVTIQTIRQDHELTLLIEDDGVGFDNTQKKRGVGFMNIRTRAALCNGTMQVTSSPGNGCSLKLQFTL